MNKIFITLKDNSQIIIFILTLLIFLNTCRNPNKVLTKKIESMSNKIDSLEKIIVTDKDLKIEGLKAEKRMIQSADRRILDVNRQSEIDKEIKELEKN
jgi:hypothetical protein